jgi:hypothetical protein
VDHPGISEAQVEREAVHELCGTFAEAWKPLVSLMVSALSVAVYMWTLFWCITVSGGQNTRLSRGKILALLLWALAVVLGLGELSIQSFRHDWHEWYAVIGLALLALLANVAVAILWWSQKHRCSRVHSTVGSRLWRGVILPLLATLLAGISTSAVYKTQAQTESLAADMEQQWLSIEGVWSALSLHVLLPFLPISIVLAQTYRPEAQAGDLVDAGWRVSQCQRSCLRCRMRRQNTAPAGDLAPSDSLSLSRRLRGGEFSQFSGGMFEDDDSDDQVQPDRSGVVQRPRASMTKQVRDTNKHLKIRREIKDLDIHRVDTFLWAQSGFVRLSALLPFALWIPYMANELQVLIYMTRQQAENPSNFRTRISADGVRALSPVVFTLNMCVVVFFGVAAMYYPAPQQWSPFVFFPLLWSLVVGFLVVVVTVALIWSLSEPKNQALRRHRDALNEFRVQMLRVSFSLQERNRSPVKKCFGYITSWHGQTLLSTVNHLFAIALFTYGIIKFSAQLTASLRIWLRSGVVLSVLGLVVSGVSSVQRKWPVLKCTPTDDSFRLACVLKIALVMTKSTIVFLLAQVDEKEADFKTWENVVSVVSVVSLLILALVTISLAVRKVWQRRYLLLEAGVWQPRVFIILYIVSFLCSKVGTIFFMLQGHVPAFVGCTPSPVFYRVGAEQMNADPVVMPYMVQMTTTRASNCTMCYVERTGSGSDGAPTCYPNATQDKIGNSTFCWTEHKACYLASCTTDNCTNYHARKVAEQACIEAVEECGGIVWKNGTWQTRVGSTAQPSPSGEDCWVVSQPAQAPDSQTTTAVPRSLPELCRSSQQPGGEDVWYMCQTSCTRLFFNSPGADEPLVVFVLAPLLWLPLVPSPRHIYHAQSSGLPEIHLRVAIPILILVTRSR